MYFPVTAAFYFHPNSASCPSTLPHCVGGSYYMNIAPAVGSTDVRASRTTESGETVDPAEEAAMQKYVEDPRRNIRKMMQDGQAKAWARQRALREAQHKSVADFEPSWIARSGMTLTGTVVARVDSAPQRDWQGRPQVGAPFAVVIFRESPDIVMCEDWSLLRQAYGADLNGLIGKTIEVNGTVVASLCGIGSACITGFIKIVENPAEAQYGSAPERSDVAGTNSAPAPPATDVALRRR